MQNNSVVLGLSVKIIKYMDSQIVGFSVLLVLTVRYRGYPGNDREAVYIFIRKKIS
jgi:hypothetical protein